MSPTKIWFLFIVPYVPNILLSKREVQQKKQQVPKSVIVSLLIGVLWLYSILLTNRKYLTFVYQIKKQKRNYDPLFYTFLAYFRHLQVFFWTPLSFSGQSFTHFSSHTLSFGQLGQTPTRFLRA